MGPTQADVLYEMYHWQLQVQKMPGWGRHFAICFKRGVKKMIRKRRSLYAKLLSVLIASMVCGAVCYVLKDDRNMLPILYMLCNALFATVIAAGSIDVLGNREEAQLLEHEAASGIQPSAEALSRLLLDLIALAPLGPAFAIPLQALSNMPIGIMPLMALYGQVAWAIATVGYIFSLIAPANSTVMTASLTLILYAFFSGALIGPSFLPKSLQFIFWFNPGYASFLQIGLGNAVRMPFSLARWALIRLFMNSEIMPMEREQTERWEFHWRIWFLPSFFSLVACGFVLRAVAVFIFSIRTVEFDLLKRLYRCCVAVCFCERAPAGTDNKGVYSSVADESISSSPWKKKSSPKPSVVPDLSPEPDRTLTFRTMIRVKEGANTWAADPLKRPKLRGVGPKASAKQLIHPVKLPPAFVIPYSKTLLGGQSKPAPITFKLPSGARLTFHPNPLMKGGDIVQFKVLAHMLVPPADEKSGKERIIYAADSFPTEKMRKTMKSDKDNAMVLVTDDAEDDEVDDDDEPETELPSEGAGSSSSPRPSAGDEGTWECQVCCTLNHILLWECEVCQKERPGKLEYVAASCEVVRTSPSKQNLAAAASSASASTTSQHEDDGTVMGAEV